jgi:hypothetical protein
VAGALGCSVQRHRLQSGYERYRSRFVNDVIACVDYQDDGLSRRDRTIYIRNPRARLVHNRELLLMDRPLPLRVLMKTCANYVRFALRHGARLEREVMLTQRFIVWLVAVPVGAGLALRDRMSLRRASA